MSTPKTPSLLEASLGYAARGWHVFPCCWPTTEGKCGCGYGHEGKDVGKAPLTSHGFKDATTDEATIREWWGRWPNANIGMACGPVRRVVLDCDEDHGGLASWRELRASLRITDETLTVLTPRGGQHLHFQALDGETIRCSAGRLGSGLDVRSDGGYVLLPPSIGANGKPYTWETGYSADERPATPLPEALQRRLLSLETPHAEVVTDRIPEGRRNETLTSLAGSMRRRGMSREAIEAALLEENQHRCDPPLTQDEVRQIAASVARYPAEEEATGQAESEQPTEVVQAPKPSAQADRLVGMVEAEGVELFHDEVGDAFARVPVSEHYEILRCRAKDFKGWMAGRFWGRERKAANSDALNSALTVLEAKACFEGAERRLHNRVAVNEGAIWYDLADRDWRAVRITSEGWEIVADPPMLFRRYSHQRPQPDPARGGDLRDLLHFVNLRDPSQGLLLLVYVVCCFVPDVPHPIPVLHGPQGSAKTTFFCVLRRLIDPSAAAVLSFPRDAAELVQQLSHHWAPFYDNISALPDWVNDILCRAVTGEGFSKRELYSDDEDIIYQFRRCIGLNGVNVAAHKPDLLDRCILFPLEPIEPSMRMPEEAIWKEFDEARPRLLGAIFDTLSKAMALRVSVHLSELPRMADWALWGCAIAKALGHFAKEFMAAYEGNTETRNEEALQASPVAAMVMELTEKQAEWEGTPSELLAELEALAAQHRVNTKSSAWPKAAHSLTRRLNEVRHNLAAAGITVTVDRSGGRRKVRLQKVAQNTVIGVTSVQESLEPQEIAGERDATAAPRDEASQIASPAGPPTDAPDDPRDASAANDASSAAHSGKAGPSSLPEGADKAVRDYAEMLVEDGMTPEEAERRAWEWTERGFPADG